MKVINKLPTTHVENKTCAAIAKYLEGKIDCDIVFRSWEHKEPYNVDGKFICIITSSEQHNYLPSEVENENCLGVFMHYPPKESQYNPDAPLLSFPKLHALPLGCTDFFCDGEVKPLNERQYDCCFIGQLDPYRRVDFFNCMKALSSISDYNSIVGFYQGWNNGLSGQDYSDVMRDSKLALVPWGSASLNTFRFYEAAKSGCIIVSAPQNKYDFMKNSPHIENGGWNIDKLVEIINENLMNQDLADKTYDFWKTNLSPEASATYILERLKND